MTKFDQKEYLCIGGHLHGKMQACKWDSFKSVLPEEYNPGTPEARQCLANAAINISCKYVVYVKRVYQLGSNPPIELFVPEDHTPEQTYEEYKKGPKLWIDQ